MVAVVPKAAQVADATATIGIATLQGVAVLS